MPLITNHMLRKKLAEVNVESRIGAVALQTGKTGTAQDNGLLTLIEKKITKVQGDKMITDDGIKAKLYFPIPGVKWVCRGVTGSAGVVSLEKPLTGLFIGDGETWYCLGVDGDTKEFEVLLKVGDTEIRISDLFINFKAKLCVKNGVEAKL